MARSLPGVESASLTTRLPYTSDVGTWAMVPEGRDSAERQDPRVFVMMISVTPEYFRTMRIPVLTGRGFGDTDRETTSPVAIVNEAFVREYWPGTPDALGKEIDFSRDGSTMTVIGVAGDVRYRPELEALPEVYVPFRQQPSSTMSVVVRTRGDPADLVPIIRQTVWEMDSKLPIRRAATMGEIASEVNARAQFYTLLLAAFAGVAVALALVGVYGTLSYTVAQRTREMGIRVALGATSGNVVGLVLGGSFRLALAGVALGMAGAWATTRLLSGFLFAITPTDGGTFAVAVLVFLAISLLASWLPARRAARLDAAIALRFDR
jgi:putative ABC transport system permease protein